LIALLLKTGGVFGLLTASPVAAKHSALGVRARGNRRLLLLLLLLLRTAWHSTAVQQL